MLLALAAMTSPAALSCITSLFFLATVVYTTLCKVTCSSTPLCCMLHLHLDVSKLSNLYLQCCKFLQDLFNDPNVMDDSDDDDDDADVDDDITTRPTKRAKSDLPAVAGVAAVRRAAVPMAATAVPTGSDEAEHEDAVAGTSDADSDEDMLPGQRSKQPGQCQRHRVTGSGDGFEIVARSQGGAGSSGSGSDSDADSDADEFDALDAHGKAEVLALAKRMLRRKDKESILDAAYNRYGQAYTWLW